MPQDLLVGDVFRNAARAVPNRLAAVHGDVSLTFAELDATANQLARVLGVGHRDRVAVWSNTDLRLAPLFAALALTNGAVKLGNAVFAPLNGLLPVN